jgi:hypothetical protein
MIAPLPNTDDWRLLTPLNIQHRRLWPWGYSIQKFVSAGEPRLPLSDHLMIASDYGGEHPQSTHLIYCYLVVRGGGREWLSAIGSTRERLLPGGRTMAYKRLDDPQRQKALSLFLSAAANLDGHLVAVAVDKQKKWLSTIPGTSDDLQKGFGLKARWKPRALESMMRKVQFPAILLSLWARPLGSVTWITDEDEFVANDSRHDDALLAAARMSSFYAHRPMGVFRMVTTAQDPELKDYEDLCSIPDLAAGMLSEVSTRLSENADWNDEFRRVLGNGLQQKANVIADWFWDETTVLRKTFISIDLEGNGYRVRKIWMEYDNEVEDQELPSTSPGEQAGQQ